MEKMPDNERGWPHLAITCFLIVVAWLAVIGLASIVLGRW